MQKFVPSLLSTTAALGALATLTAVLGPRWYLVAALAVCVPCAVATWVIAWRGYDK